MIQNMCLLTFIFLTTNTGFSEQKWIFFGGRGEGMGKGFILRVKNKLRTAWASSRVGASFRGFTVFSSTLLPQPNLKQEL